MEIFLRWGMNESRIKLLCMTVFSYYMVTACSAATEYNSPNVGTTRSPIHRASSSTDYYHVNNTSLSYEQKAGVTRKEYQKKKLHKKHKSDVCLSSSFCPSWFLINFTRHPHFFLDDDEAAAIIPPATSPTSPKAPVMIAMPIIPSASNTNQVMLAQIRRTINSAKI